MDQPLDQQRLTVAYIGNFTRPWCTEVHVAGSLQALGHKVVRLQENELRWQNLPRLVAHAKADVLLWTRTWDVPVAAVTAALQQVRADGVPTAFYHLDRWWGLEREYQVHTMPWFQAVDVVFSPDGQPDRPWAEAGVNHVFLPPGVYEPECRPVPPNPARWPHQVVFVGSHPYPHPAWEPIRTKLLQTFADHFGDRFKVWPEPGRPIRNRDLQELYATAPVVLGDSCLVGEATHYWSDRIPETLGRCGLLIHPHVEGLDEWYPSVGVVGVPWPDVREHANLLTYQLGEFTHAVDLAEWALAHPTAAAEIAERGQQTVLARDTYRHRMATVLQYIQEHVKPGSPGFAAVVPPEAGESAPEPPAAVQTPLASVLTRTATGLGASKIITRPRAGAGRGTFHIRAGHPTDTEVINEVWQTDQYQVRPEQVRGGLVIDIGANIGAFTVLAIRMGAAEVHAYEPEPANFQLLEANVDANLPVLSRPRVLVDASCEAVGAAAGECRLIPGPGGTHGGGTHVAGPDEPDETPFTWVAPVRPIAEVIPEGREVALLKLDCEGAEYEIMDAMPERLLPQVRRIVMEFHGPGMPHLTHLAELGEGTVPGWRQVWGEMVAKLAAYGRVHSQGNPWMGGLLQWERN
jgi:FkbM family methyltransferase